MTVSTPGTVPSTARSGIRAGRHGRSSGFRARTVPELRPGCPVAVANERDVVRFGVLRSRVDLDGPWPTVLVDVGGELRQVDARDVEPLPCGPSRPVEA